MNSNDISLEKLQRACGNQRFRDAVLALADAYLTALDYHSTTLGDWTHLGSELSVELIGSLAMQLQGNKRLEFDDIGETINPIRTLWRLCFERFAQKSVCATNYVTAHWTSSTQQEAHDQIQRAAIQRNVIIERIFMIEKDLPERTLNELRHNVLRQLSAGVSLRAIRPNTADSLIDTKGLGTRDFIIFDESVVYATHVDSQIDKRFMKKTKVHLHYDRASIDAATEAWNVLKQNSNELTNNNLHKWVDPYAE